MPRTKSQPITGTIDPLSHSDYYEVSEKCACPVCHDWRTKRRRFYAHNPDAWKKIQKGELVVNHSRACKCKVCTDPKYIKARTAYLAATERWNLYCESSWHAENEPLHLGEAYMSWLKSTLADRETRSDGWWEGRSPYLQIQWWITLFKADMRKESERLQGAIETISGIPKAAVEFSANLLAASGVFAKSASAVSG